MMWDEKNKKRLSELAKKRIGELSSNWRGGRIIVDGYVYIYCPNHPFRTKDKYVCEHRLVMEKMLGRYLKPSEVVHHINENKQDNRIENLRLYSSVGKHFVKEHAIRDKFGRFQSAKGKIFNL